MAELTQRLARFVAEIDAGQLPPAVIDQTKRCLLDLIGIALRASAEADSTPALVRAVDELAPAASGSAGGPSTAIGLGRRYPAQYAAFLNGALAHSLDFDDTHAGSSLHPGATVIPAALALGEAADIPGRAVLGAIVAGYEITCRLAEALRPDAHYERGFHPTATCGQFGAATAATLVGGPAEAAQRIANAWGITLSFASGTMQFVENGAWNKRFQVGWSAHNGVVAAVLDRQGVVGAARPFEGRFGLLHGYSLRADPERALQDLGSCWKVCETALKPYPCCRYTHSAIDGVVALVTEHDLRPEEIEAIWIGMCTPGIQITAVPEDRKRDPYNVVDGQFSMHWTAAVAAVKRRMGWSDYALLRDPAVLALAARTSVEVDPEAEANFPAAWSARVRITARGQEFERFVLRPSGEPELPMGWPEVEAKFHGLAESALDPAARERVVALVRDVDALPSVRELTAALRPLAAAAVGD